MDTATSTVETFTSLLAAMEENVERLWNVR